MIVKQVPLKVIPFKFREMECKHKNDFCFICGRAIELKSKYYDMRHQEMLQTYFRKYFKREFVGDLWFAPDYSCGSCARKLYGWAKHEPRQKFNFKIPMTWREPPFHDANACFFCNTKRTYLHHSKIEYQYSDYTVPPMPRAEYENPPVYDEKEGDDINQMDIDLEQNDPDVDVGAAGGSDEIQITSEPSSRRTTATIASEATNTYPPLIQPKKRHFLTAQDINDIGKNAE